MADSSPLLADLLQQLQAAEQWLKVLVTQFDLEPEETAFVVDVVAKEGGRTSVARITLAHSMSQITAAIEAGRKAMETGRA